MKYLSFVFLFCTMYLYGFEPIEFGSISNKNGLSNNSIADIIQDSYGFMWFGTYDGLNCYDGVTCRSYLANPKDKQSLCDPKIYCLFEDADRDLWIGTAGGGICRYNRKLDLFENYPNQPFYTANSIIEIKPHILLISTEFGLYEYNKTTKIFSKKTFNGDLHSFNNSVYKIIKDSYGLIWISYYKGMCVVDSNFKVVIKKTEKEYIGTTDKKGVNYLYEDRHGDIWIAIQPQTIIKYDRKKNVFNTILSDLKKFGEPLMEDVLDLTEDDDNNIWIGTINGGLLLYNTANSTFTRYKSSQYIGTGLHGNTVSALYRDKSGIIWIGTHKAGVHYYAKSNNRAKCYKSDPSDKNNLSFNNISAFFEDYDGSIWIGTDGGGLNKFNPKTGTFERFNLDNGFPVKVILDITRKDKTTLFLATWSLGLVEFNTETHSCKMIKNLLFKDKAVLSSNIRALHKSSNILYMGTQGAGACKYNIDTHTFSREESISKDMTSFNWVNDIVCDSKGRIWYGTYWGLFCVKDNKYQTYVNSKNNPRSISSNLTHCIFEDSKHTIWIGTNNGLNRYNEKTNDFTVYRKSSSMESDYICSIIEDNNHELWISTNNGIVKFNTATNAMTRYDVDIGLQNAEFTPHSVLKSSNGLLYFGGVDGFNIIDPTKMTGKSNVPPIYLTGIELFYEKQNPRSKNSIISKSMILTDTVTIHWNQSTITFEYVALSLESSYKNRYKCLLEGFDKKWQDHGNERKATYTNLNPGTYIFKVIGANKDGIWNYKGASVTLIILPPWWKTWWFILLLSMFIIGAIIGFIFYRTYSIQMQNIQLEELVVIRTNDLIEANSGLIERNEEIKQQRDYLEEYNNEVLRQNTKILNQQEQIVEQNRKLSELNSTKDKLFSIIAHDLKNPVNAIIGFSDLIINRLETLTPDKINTFLTHINSSSHTLMDLLMNLLDWARSQTNTIQFSPEVIPSNKIIYKIINQLELQFKNKNIALETELNHTHLIWVDLYMIETVIRNIVSNCIKYTPNNGLINIQTLSDNQTTKIIITDTGVGMTNEQADNLFNVVKNRSTPGTNNEKGTGLGLLICKEFISKNNGIIEVLSTINVGSVFTLTFPANGNNISTVNLEIPKVKENVYLKQDKQYQSIRGKRILIVEDDDMFRLHLHILLSSHFEIIEASDGEEGLRVSTDIQPDLIITDINMPKMNGIDFCSTIKNNKSSSHIPVILISSEIESTIKNQIKYSGADFFLSKPVMEFQLFEAIEKVFDQRKIRHNNIKPNTKLNPADFTSNALDIELLTKLIQYVEENIYKPSINSDTLCDVFAMSRSVLYSKLKNTTGMSVNEFVRTIRLQKSVEFLLKRRYSIIEIAEMTGFSSQSYFTRSFIKSFNVSPSDYLKSL